MPENRSYHLSCGKTRYVSFDSVSRNRLHKHTYFEPCIVISGSGEFEHGATTHALRAGDLFIADRGVFHEIRSLESRDLELYFLSFLVTDAQAGRTVARENLVPEPSITAFLARHRQHLPGQAHLVPLFEHVSRLGRRERGPRGERDVLDLSLLLVRQVVEALSDSASLSDDAYSDRLQKARVEEHIENHLHRPLRVAELARACGMSERTLRRRWQNWSRHSLPEAINRRRIERACHLLLLPDMSIADVGYQVGIESPAQFSRCFRKVKGTTPGAYRSKAMTEAPLGFLSEDVRRTEFLDDGEPG